MDEEALDFVHKKMETLLGQSRVYIDDLYYCPHHPETGFEGEVPELKIECECRKPNPGMLLQAASDYNIDLSRSYIIGDRVQDCLAGKNANVSASILIASNTDTIDADAYDYTFSDTLEAVKSIVKGEL